MYPCVFAHCRLKSLDYSDASVGSNLEYSLPCCCQSLLVGAQCAWYRDPDCALSQQTLTDLQARVKAIAEIVSELIAGVKEGRDVDLNNVKREVHLSNRLIASTFQRLSH